MTSRLLFSKGNMPFSDVQIATTTASLLSSETGNQYIPVPYGEGFAIQCREDTEKKYSNNADTPVFNEIYLRPAWRSLLPELFIMFLLTMAILNSKSLMLLLQIDVLQSALYNTFHRTFQWAHAITGFKLILMFVLSIYSLKVFYFRFSHWYFIGPKGVESNVGIISKDQTRIEYKHARGANMQQTVLGRIIGYGTVVIPTSGQEEVCFQDVASPGNVLNELRKRLRELA